MSRSTDQQPSFLHRNNVWLRQLRERREKALRAQQAKEISQCPFKPRLNPAKENEATGTLVHYCPPEVNTGASGQAHDQEMSGSGSLLTPGVLTDILSLSPSVRKKQSAPHHAACCAALSSHDLSDLYECTFQPNMEKSHQSYEVVKRTIKHNSDLTPAEAINERALKKQMLQICEAVGADRASAEFHPIVNPVNSEFKHVKEYLSKNVFHRLQAESERYTQNVRNLKNVKEKFRQHHTRRQSEVPHHHCDSSGINNFSPVMKSARSSTIISCLSSEDSTRSLHEAEGGDEQDANAVRHGIAAAINDDGKIIECKTNENGNGQAASGDRPKTTTSLLPAAACEFLSRQEDFERYRQSRAESVLSKYKPR
jgi:hypothetical protein